MKLKAFLLTCLFYFSTQGKILIITISFNRPDFIEIQHRTFKYFLKDDYEFIVFNDANKSEINKAIKETCNKLNLKHYRIPPKIHSLPYLKREAHEDFQHPCCRCANAVQYAINNSAIHHNDIVMLMDSDMFLIKNFNVKKYLSDHHIAGVNQSRITGKKTINYIWNALVIFNMPILPNKKEMNFNCGNIEGVGTDVGGYMYYFFQKNPLLKIKFIEAKHINHYLELENINYPEHDLLIREEKNNFHLNIDFLENGSFLHYRGGGNWNNQSLEYHLKKTHVLNSYINKILSNPNSMRKSYLK